MNESKNFMLLFRFQPDFKHQPSEEELSEQKQQWGAFIGKVAIQEKLVSTYQLGFDGKQISSDLSETDGMHISGGNTLGGNMVIKANSMEEAVSIAKECPILKINGTVEVRSIVPMES
ncbi:MAG: YciI family protein [Bacteroidota bacterium]